MLGEQERRDRFGYALSQALAARDMSERQLAKALEIDPRQVAKWRMGKGLPDLYQTRAIENALKISPRLFEEPPPVPKPPRYPIEEYLLGAVDEGVRRGLTDPDPSAADDDEPDEPPAPRRATGRWRIASMIAGSVPCCTTAVLSIIVDPMPGRPSPSLVEHRIIGAGESSCHPRSCDSSGVTGRRSVHRLSTIYGATPAPLIPWL